MKKWWVAMFRISRRKKLSVTLQEENNDCGLACILMLYTYFNQSSTSIQTLKNELGSYPRGMSLLDIKKSFERLGMSAKAVRLKVESLYSLKEPIMLHWGMNHFVVFEKVRKNMAYIIDPAIGRRTVPIDEFLEDFTGFGVVITSYHQSDMDGEKEKTSFSGNIYESKGLLFILLCGVCFELSVSLFPIVFSILVRDFQINPSLISNIPMITFMLLIFCSTALIGYIRDKYVHLFEKKVKSTTSDRVISRVFRFPLGYYETHGVGDTISRIKSIDIVYNSLIKNVIPAFNKSISVLISLGFILYLDYLAFFICLVGFSVNILVSILTSKRISSYENQAIIFQSKQDTSLIESINAITSIRLNNKVPIRIIDWANYFSSHINSTIKRDDAFINTKLYQLIIDLFFRLGFISYLLSTILAGRMDLIVFSLLVLYREISSSSIISLSENLYQIYISKVHLERFNKLDSTQTVDDDKDLSDFLYIFEVNETLGIDVKNLKYKPEKHAPYMLKNVNFCVDPGCSVSIEGSSGSGKTTIFKSILGLYDVESCEILIFDSKTRLKVSPHQLKNISSFVFQDDILISGTIAQNISFFRDSVDMDYVVECCKIACIHEEIMDFKLRYNTVVGREGTTLSSGQVQRILLARALYSKPKFLFLDESSSNLDIELERKINANINKESITKIVISHRKETIDATDVHYKLDSGVLKNVRETYPQKLIS
ncbi:peptidase domain-containing ABC transporter [Vibrio splendidus]|nr:cysteine peptidase family C39 domain-containing protein [Vibrio splendidus]